MAEKIVGTNTLYFDIICPYCDKPCSSGIGFRAGVVRQLNYRLGMPIEWSGPNCRPNERPAGGKLKTIGYFNCDNPSCKTWTDCFPEVQEALITIDNDIINDARVIEHKPSVQSFDIIEPEGLN